MEYLKVIFGGFFPFEVVLYFSWKNSYKLYNNKISVALQL